ncbi:hypothetical protein Q2T42_21885 [Leptolyngbya boryana CZ1]|uniref:Uncharacterized protein n=1 Tax=Leptolyngbya boryana CZ1 TaxID=3060204 RepID=A0AA97ARV4_LEPBY|nr:MULTISPECIES: hypothetical protein [Leptolyngbya]MBD1857969.1 hypothetical protein [Leptolyngbya sp. FACHB-1624]WNZ44455.1 hypothetical protein Q2T42_21885 [Leptolyngbya boryana CZ1]
MLNRNSTENTLKKSAPHHRISVKDVIRDYQAGLLTPAGAIFYLIAASRRIGQSIRVSISQICRQLDLSRATYYRAIGTLAEQGRLRISAPDEMELSIPISTTEGVPDYIFLEELSQICDNLSQNCDRNSQICDNLSQNCDNLSQICDNQGLEPRTQAESGSPQLTQLDQSFKQLTTESVSPPTHPVDQRLKESGIELTEAQLLQIEHFTAEQIEQAIAVVQNSKRVQDKVKFFFKALRNGWRPNLPRESAPSNFGEWFDRARAQGRVVASMMGGDGILRILMPDERWLTLADAILEVSGS